MKIIKQGTISAKNAGKLNYNGWPSVITLSDGTLLAGWSGDRYRHICPFGKVLASRSADGGYTWCPPYVIQNTPLDDRDAGFCEADGRIVLTSFNNSRAQQRYYAEKDKWSFSHRAFAESYLNLITDADEARYLGSTIAVSTDNGMTFSDPVTLPITSPPWPLSLTHGRAPLHRPLLW